MTALGMAARWGSASNSDAAVMWARQAVYISRGLGPAGKQTLMDNLFNLGLVGLMGAVHLDETEALLAPFAEAQSIQQELGTERFPGEQYLSTEASFALMQANTALQEGQFEKARLEAGRSSRLYEQARNPWGSYLAQICLGAAYFNLGAHDLARERFLSALRQADETGNPKRKAYVRYWLAQLEFQRGDLEQAGSYGRSSMEQATRLGDEAVATGCMSLLANIETAQRNGEHVG
jgi:ATP/maltotriose-dependent transcriptional regulator MalT